VTAATASTARTTGSRRPLAIGIGVAIALVVVAVLAGQGGSGEGAPLSPSSTSPDGLRGLVLLMESFGADVRTNQRVPDAGVRFALLARDGLDQQGRDDLRSWVRGGGTLVVADPDSPLTTFSSDERGGFTLVRGHCDLAGLNGADRIEIGGLNKGSLDVLGGLRYRVGDNLSCFGDGTTAYVVETRLGSGTILSVGAPNLFTNAFLADEDDSVLAMRLLQPDGAEPVAVLSPGAPGSGRTTLLDLVPDRVIQAVVQVGIAFLIYALWRARRLGRPVVERQPVAIAGSQLVQAVGALEQRTHATDRAAAAMRHDVRRLVSERYGLAPRSPATTLANVVSERTGLDLARVAAALNDTPVPDERALLALTYELDLIRKEILHGS
jgi:hypothetical protein